MLSLHFSVKEWTRNKHNIKNVPSDIQLERGKALAVAILEPWRAKVGPIHINSGFRNEEVNQLADGVSNSQHQLGEAADCRPLNKILTLTECFKELIKLNLDIDQAILYPTRGFIHVSHKSDRTKSTAQLSSNRREYLYSPSKGRYFPWV